MEKETSVEEKNYYTIDIFDKPQTVLIIFNI
jgi:hypothetical protein